MPDLGALPPIPRAPRVGGAGAGAGAGAPSTPSDIAFDILALRAQGLDHLRSLARATWTDHNTHDPGVTILELASYALTELAYRADLPIDDLIVRPGATPASTDEQTASQFHRARAILPNRPWTALDWRKCLIDLVGVKNAWIEPDEGFKLVADLRRRELRRDPPPQAEPADGCTVTLRGLYRVRIEFMATVQSAAQRNAVLRRVQASLQAQRNLGEDFTEVLPVQPQFFALCAEIDLDAHADVTEAAARLLFDLSQTIAPPVLNHALATMLARGRTLPDVLEGPLPEHGAIDTAELVATALPSEIRLSDLIGVSMDVPGIRSVRDLLLNPLTVGLVDGVPVDGAGDAVEVSNPWRVPVAAGCLPRLSLANGRLVFSKRGTPVAGWQIDQMPAAVHTRLAALHEAAAAKVETVQSMEPPFVAGRARDLAAYHSFQHDFPGLYRIGAEGLHTTAPTTTDAEKARHAQALQLQAYLLFFDQWMADQLVTLSRASRRFSVAPADLGALATGWTLHPQQQHVLAAQPVTSIPAHIKLYIDHTTGSTDATLLAGLIESPVEAATRQQLTLDHLLARVGEDTFADYAAIIGSAFAASDASVIADKCAFLEAVADLQHSRAGAYLQFPETEAGVWNTANVSGFERRLSRLLGIADFTRRNLGTVAYDTYAEVDATPDDEFRFRVRHRITGQILLSSSTHYVSPEAARVEMMQAIERGQQPGGYQRAIAGDSRHYFNIIDGAGEVIARRIQYFETAQAMDQQILELMAYLRTQYSGEGLYLVEHLLLRPTEPDDPMLPICNDVGNDCTDIDPYSHRVHIVLPAYAGRFRTTAFREFVEETIRRELPAHLLPTVCWIDTDDMAVFERAWHDWLTLHAGFSPGGAGARAAKLQALIDALVSARNIYPSRNLFDCTDDETKPPFILGKTSLGHSGRSPRD